MFDVEFYVLGLLRFDKENEESVVLSDEQLKLIKDCLSTKIGGKLEERDPWLVFKLSNTTDLGKKIQDILSGQEIQEKQIQLCELGYYHHRIIFKLHLSLSKEYLLKDKFKILREIREKLHQTIRKFLKDVFNSVNENIINKSHGINLNPKMLYIYTYPLIIIYDGVKLVKEVQKDRIFDISTTTFFFKIPEVKYRILLRSHFVRISIPGMIVYADKEIDNLIFWELVNGIYYAALYSKKLQDITSQKSIQWDEKFNKLNESILCKLSSYLNEGIVALEMQEVGNRIAWIALIISMASILVLTVISFISKII
ncbi:MAG: hypothetical protein QXY96_04660 [Candidatus Methanomethylicaceae archaeon]